MTLREYTVGELIAALQQFPVTHRVGVKAACCLHAHNEIAVYPVPDEPNAFHDDEVDVVIESQ